MGPGESTPARRAAGLRDHRLTLWCRPGIQRASGFEVLALMMNGMNLRVIDQHAALAVGDNGVRFPRSPKTSANLHVFVRHVVAQVVLGHAIHPEIHRCKVRTARHNVPTDTARRHLVERRDQTGEQIGMIGIGAECGDDADAGCDLCHQRRHNGRILTGHSDAVLEIDLG